MKKRLKRITKKPLFCLPGHSQKKSGVSRGLSVSLAKEPEETEKIKKTKIKVIGIGGGGGSIVSEIALRIEKVNFVVANTELRALKESPKKIERFQFGQNLTHGLGTGMNPELGEMAAENDKERIKKLLNNQDLCILVASLGGGTGSGATPIFARISRNLGNITYGIFTLPFKFEGEKKIEIARDSLEKLKPNLNAFSIIPNERIFQTIERTTPLKSALSQINKTLAEALEGLIEMIYQPGLINIDFADLRTVLERRGRLTYLNTTEVEEGSDRVKEAIQKVLTCPLYPYNIRGAKGILFNIAGSKTLGLVEVGQISKAISELVNKEAKIIFGASQGKKYKDKIKITLLATGCGAKFLAKPKRKLKLKVKISKAKSKRKTRPKEKLRKKIETKSYLTSKDAQAKKKKLQSSHKIPKPQLKKRKMKLKVPIEKKSIQTKETGPSSLPISSQERGEITPVPSEKNETKPIEIKEINSQGQKVRKNALQLRKEVEEQEKKLLREEEKWEPPAFLRKKAEEV